MAEKQPHLRVISDASVAEAAAAKPSLLFSEKVLIHVHPDELVQYFRNVLRIIGRFRSGHHTRQMERQENHRLQQPELGPFNFYHRRISLRLRAAV